MKKIFFAAVFAGALLGFTSCGNREMVTDPEMETVIDSIKETERSDDGRDDGRD